MKKLKLSALQIGAKELLTREHMRSVYGGSDGDGSGEDGWICKSTNCTVFDPSTNVTHNGSCDGTFVFVPGPIFGEGGNWAYVCYCSGTPLGFYQTNGVSHCRNGN